MTNYEKKLGFVNTTFQKEFIKKKVVREKPEERREWRRPREVVGEFDREEDETLGKIAARSVVKQSWKRSRVPGVELVVYGSGEDNSYEVRGGQNHDCILLVSAPDSEPEKQVEERRREEQKDGKGM
jgi:hypothetical protein